MLRLCNPLQAKPGQLGRTANAHVRRRGQLDLCGDGTTCRRELKASLTDHCSGPSAKRWWPLFNMTQCCWPNNIATHTQHFLPYLLLHCSCFRHFCTLTIPNQKRPIFSPFVHHIRNDMLISELDNGTTQHSLVSEMYFFFSTTLWPSWILTPNSRQLLAAFFFLKSELWSFILCVCQMITFLALLYRAG